MSKLSIPIRQPMLACLTLLVASLCCHPAGAAQRALLIGVTGYPTLPAKLRLQGPVNDVRAMRDALLRIGMSPTAITTLADGLDDSALPTREEIMGSLARLAGESRRGDQVLVFFAGHGSQQPQLRATKNQLAEPDGLDEIFLPLDIGRWDGRIGRVGNAITDDEIGQALSAIVGRGAMVWAIFDTCHAGSMLRSGAAPTRLRAISPVTLGQGARRVGRRDPAREADTDYRIPGVVAFMAAGPDEQAPEEDLLDANGERVRRGVFSHALLNSLSQQPHLSFAALFDDIRAQYRLQGRLSPQPRMEPAASGANEVAGQAFFAP